MGSDFNPLICNHLRRIRKTTRPMHRIRRKMVNSQFNFKSRPAVVARSSSVLLTSARRAKGSERNSTSICKPGSLLSRIQAADGFTGIMVAGGNSPTPSSSFASHSWWGNEVPAVTGRTMDAEFGAERYLVIRIFRLVNPGAVIVRPLQVEWRR